LIFATVATHAARNSLSALGIWVKGSFLTEDFVELHAHKKYDRQMIDQRGAIFSAISFKFR
jgi:hypothetical protein